MKGRDATLHSRRDPAEKCSIHSGQDSFGVVWGLVGMGQIISLLRMVRVSCQISDRYHISEERQGMHSRLEHAIVNAFAQEERLGLFVHWGAYASGKSTAAKNAAITLQRNFGRLAILLRGYDFPWKITARDWIQTALGIPDDCKDDMIHTLLPHSRRPVLIIDQVDLVLNRYGSRDLLLSLRELGMPVLCLATSWEHASDLNECGYQLLGAPGFGRWFEAELLDLYHTLPRDALLRCRLDKASIMQCAVLSGSPGVLRDGVMCDSKQNMKRAKLMDAEWQNGVRALERGDTKGVIGRFPDKAGIFHWD